MTTLTDPLDIRKWTKARYDEKMFKTSGKADKLKKLSKFLTSLRVSNHNGTSPDDKSQQEPSEHDHTEDSESSVGSRPIHEIPKVSVVTAPVVRGIQSELCI